MAAATETVKSELSPPVKWLPPENYHITLRFLGDTPQTALPGIEALLRGIGETLSGVEVQAGGAGCFPTCRRPRVIYIGVEDPGSGLSLWHEALEDALLQELGLPKEQKPFRPHVTAGYSRDHRPGDREKVQEAVERLGALTPVRPEELQKIVLFRSNLGPKGALHEPLVV
ncbi:MAG: RNA 2',3'-cyclic phosphodiesterase, partial [Spirochaetaceae bacterium]